MLGTLVGRARDARSAHPWLGDAAASEVVDRVALEDLAWVGVDDDLALSIAVRARLLDRWCRDFLDAHPDALVLHLACGLDTRWERLRPGPSVDWYDVDQAGVMGLRERLLPAHHAGQHALVADVTTTGWLAGLPTGRPTLVVAEGLTMYLRPETGGALLARLVDRFGVGAGPGGEMVFDAYSPLGVRLARLNPVVRRSGARLRWAVEDPRTLEPLGLTLLEELQLGDVLGPGIRARMSPRMRLRLRTALVVPAFRTMGRLLRYRF